MPWSEITIMSERAEFVRCVLQRRTPVAEVCAAYGISEKTGYKWLARFRCEGASGLADRSHAPHHVHRMDATVAAELLALRHVHPTWGPRKLLAYAAARDPGQRWPAASSLGVLAGEDVGLEEVGDARWSITLGPLHLAYLDSTQPQQHLTPSVYWRYSPIMLDSTSPIIPV